MATRLFMIISAAFLALLGLLTSFMPVQVLAAHGSAPDEATVLLIRMMGALYLGFAILNWSARGVIIGGIYARPLALGNFVHFFVVALTLGKAAWLHAALQLAASTAVFAGFAIGFGVLLFTTPRRVRDT